MTNLEWLKKNLSDEEKENDEFCYTVYQKLNGKNCDIISCDDCYFNKYENILNFLLEEHKKPIKLKQWEFDLIKSFDVGDEYTFEYFRPLKLMKEIGYFIDIKDTTMNMKSILENCEIVSDDYEGFEDCK